jgi:hypothetical protein
MLMAGFLPFSAIYVELYYIFASVWGHKVYIIWSILLIVYIILIIVTAFITVALTYFQVRGLLRSNLRSQQVLLVHHHQLARHRDCVHHSGAHLLPGAWAVTV